MKKILMFSLALALVSACSKDQETDNLASKKNDGVNYDPSLWANVTFSLDCESLISTVDLDGGKLVFTDNQHFLDLRECLENSQDQYVNLFEEIYSEYSDEELEVIEDGVGFDENDVLYMFLANFPTFNSLFAKIDDEENAWLENGDTTQPDPDNHPVQDDFERVFLNESSDVLIGTELYNFAALSDANVVGKAASSCWWSKNREITHYFSKNNRSYRVKRYVGISWRPWATEFFTKTKSYKKRSGKYRKYRTNHYVKISGSCSADDCETYSGFSYDDKEKKRKSIVVRTHVGGGGHAKAGPDKVLGTHEYLGWFRQNYLQ